MRGLFYFILLMTCLHFQTINAELFKVIGPDQPVIAVLGKAAELSCHLSPVLSAEHMEVRWFRSSFQLVVHLYENGMDQNEHQIPEYRGRTELIRNYISCGIVSLRIYNIGPDDEGSYTCFFKSDTSYEDATLELKVAQLFKVIGPDQPVIAVLGKDAELSCHLSPVLSAEHMEVRWFRSSFQLVVHLYENGMDQNEHQVPEYRGRTELIRNYISCGIVSLRIYNIGPDDEGSYTCFFKSDTSYEDATLELKVVRLGSIPSISMNDYQDRGIRILCESAGWYPEPEVTWREEAGQSLVPASETELQRQNGLFDVKTSLLMRTNQYNKITCHIGNTVMKQERESAISIAGIFFQRVSRWMVSLSILLVSVIIPFGLLVVLVIYHLMKERHEKESLRTELEFARCCSYAVNVTLDPETASPYLILSEDRKSVRNGGIRQKLPDNPQRFDPVVSVLGCESFTSGRHYWEVEVGDKTDWTLGVCKDSVSRKGDIILAPEDGYWTVAMRDRDKYWACTSSWTLLSLSVRPWAVGIFLDYEAGKVSFYNAENKSHLFTFTNTFTEKLQPYFSPYLNKAGTNAGALRIRPVPDWELVSQTQGSDI
ncbi:butyrophilin subfamily 1 member A1-like [Microcaecilia unicolor]|uniref:Butyrophilin subfamily 1 member A1-like n=1 Tax=Microcaecilia unicolor TaxID=1415580 RepID=A0A6P7XCT9_9AMPH|nr:butyrophilin subfamily 1 member A1-like [Microcaecilia unicolor]